MEELALKVRGVLTTLQGKGWTDEYALQDEIAAALSAFDVPYKREEPCGRGDRLDFLIDGCLALEVKVDGPAAGLIRQLHRYLAHEEIQGAMLVTTRAHHRQVHGSLRGKPVFVFWLRGV